MASFTHVAQDVSPQYGRVTKITIRVCVTDCTGTRRNKAYFDKNGSRHRRRKIQTCKRCKI